MSKFQIREAGTDVLITEIEAEHIEMHPLCFALTIFSDYFGIHEVVASFPSDKYVVLKISKDNG